MDAASLFANGNLQYVNEDYEEALKHYTVAVTLQDCAEHRSARAAALLKVGKFAETLEEAAAALKFEPLCHMALHWRGIALFYMGDFAGAKCAFEESLRASPKAKAPRALWLRKCDAELSGSTLPLGGLSAESSKAAPAAVASGYPPQPAASSSGGAAAAAASAIAAAAAAPVTVEEDTLGPKASAAAADTAPQSGLSITGRKPVKYEWIQSNHAVIITIYAKEVQRDACTIDFKERELSLSFPLPGSSTQEDFQLNVDLFDVVDPPACRLEVSKMKVEVVLAKKDTGIHWKALEAVEEVLATPDQPAYPTSNKQKRDWSQIDRDIDQELKNEKPAGDEALNSLFKQIYDRADDETRRAMNKSFQTSGGTVLSTNWGEVARSDYEGKDRPTAPDGQQWKDWKDK